MHARIATLNIRQGGAKAAEALTSRLLGYGADLLVVNEFSANAAGAQLISRLESAGYTSAHPSVDRRHNTVLVASRRDLTPHGTFTSNGLDPRHLMVRPRRRRPWCAASTCLKAPPNYPNGKLRSPAPGRAESTSSSATSTPATTISTRTPEAESSSAPRCPAGSPPRDSPTSGDPCTRTIVNFRGSADPPATASASTTYSLPPTGRSVSPPASSTTNRGKRAKRTTPGWWRPSSGRRDLVLSPQPHPPALLLTHTLNAAWSVSRSVRGSWSYSQPTTRRISSGSAKAWSMRNPL